MTQTCRGDSYTCFKLLTDSLASVVYKYDSVKRMSAFASWWKNGHSNGTGCHQIFCAPKETNTLHSGSADGGL